MARAKAKATLSATATKTMADYTRMDYASKGRMYIGLKAEVYDGSDISLPVDSSAHDGDKFFCVDSGEVFIFYKGTWYKQS